LCANANLTTADYGWGQIHSRIWYQIKEGGNITLFP
jgi:hypothetical protein